jgi:demethylmenaquinone methyltransferase/2-methoxy-6-polyprenyl-1,4-benzoquinol methylase
MKKKTHFGFKEVESSDKEGLVKGVFDSVAKNYDIMNDLMSFGLHRVWKKILQKNIFLKNDSAVLDIAGGSGDISILLKSKNPKITLIHSDINFNMIKEGQKKIIDNGLIISSVLFNAEHIPFPKNSFDIITIGFGLRNMTNKDKVLKECLNVLKPGGKIFILEFSKIWKPLEKAYELFSFKIIPKIGKLVANDEASYQYLAESIKMHPNQDSLKKLMQDSGFIMCSYQNLTGGVVSIHQGYKA